jgi:hypothetical protein
MLVSRQIIRRRRRADRVRPADRQECRPAESRFIKTREPRLGIERPLFQRLKDHLVADLADPDLGALEAEFLGQAHGLAAAMHEQFGGCAHDPPPQYGRYQ